jgi:hypothetical protein
VNQVLALPVSYSNQPLQFAIKQRKQDDIISLDASKTAALIDLLFEQLNKVTALTRCTSIESQLQFLVLDWFKLLVDQLFARPHDQLIGNKYDI